MASRSNIIAKNTIFLFIRMVLVAIVGLYTSRVILETLGVDDFGTYNLVATLVVMFSFFKNALTNATYRFLAFDIGIGNKLQLEYTFSMSINVHLLLSLLIFILSECVAPWYIGSQMKIAPDRIPAAQMVFQFSLLAFAFDTIRTPFSSLIIAHEQMNFYALTSIVEVVLKLGVVFLLLIIPLDKLVIYSVLLSLVTISLFIWMIAYCRLKFTECKYHQYWDGKLFKKLLVYSCWSMVVNATDVAVIQSIGIFLNRFFGLAANAAYGITTQVNALLNNFVHNFTQSLNPQIIKSYAAGDKSYFLMLVYIASKISIILFVLISFPIVYNIDFLLKIWLVNPPELTAQFLYCIVVCSGFDAISNSLWTSVHATGNLKVHQTLMSLIKILNIPISYFLLTNGYHVIWVLIVFASLNGVCWIVRVVYLRSLISLSPIFYLKDVVFRTILAFTISILPTVFVCQLIQRPIVKLIVSSFLFMVLYAPVIYFVAFNDNEKILCRSMLTTIKKKIFENLKR